MHEDFNLPMNSPIPGSELTREPFRWDQRLFALVLRLAGNKKKNSQLGFDPRVSCLNSPVIHTVILSTQQARHSEYVCSNLNEGNYFSFLFK